MFRTLTFAGAVVFSFYPIDTIRLDLDETASIQLATTTQMFGEGVEVFHCQDCHQAPTEQGAYFHYFHLSANRSAPPNTETSANELSELMAIPFVGEQTRKLETTSMFATEFASVATEDEGPDSPMDCHSFNACHENPQYNLCAQNHHACGGGSSEVLSAVLGAQKLNSLAEMNAVAAKFPRFVRVVADRRVVLLIDCKGELVRQEKFTDSSSGGI